MRRATGLIFRVVGSLLLVVAGASLALPAANATPSMGHTTGANPATPTRMSLGEVAVGAGQSTVSGLLVAQTNGEPVTSVAVTIAVDGAAVTTTITDGSGAFNASFVTPPAGAHLLVASFATTANWGASSASTGFTVIPQKVGTAVTVTLDADSATPGLSIDVSGVLTNASGAPVPGATLTVTCDWNCEAQGSSPTDASGNFDANITLPDASGAVPASVTITVTYDGDNVYTGTANKAKIPLAAAPTETATADATATATTAATSTATSTAHATATASSSASPSGVGGTGSAVVGFLLIVFGAVAVLGVVTLITIGVVSSRRHRLPADEQRGFGSDFGKHEH